MCFLSLLLRMRFPFHEEISQIIYYQSQISLMIPSITKRTNYPVKKPVLCSLPLPAACNFEITKHSLR